MELPDYKSSSVQNLEHRLGQVIAERLEVAKKELSTTEPASKTWYSARLRILNTEIHKLKNQLFIAKNMF